MAETAVLICHDLVPAASPLRAVLRRLSGEPVLTIDAGSRMRPLGSEALLHAIAEHAPGRVFVARNAQWLRPGDAPGDVRSVVPIAHPVLLTLRQFEHWATGEQQAASGAAEPEAVTARMVAALAAERPAYPFAGGVSELLSGWLDDAGIAVLDAVVSAKEHTNLPDHHHPNAAGHRLFAERIDTYLAGLERDPALAAPAAAMAD